MRADAPAGMLLCAQGETRYAASADGGKDAAAALLQDLTCALGERPRRLGSFAQLSLAGALACRARLMGVGAAAGTGPVSVMDAETALVVASSSAVWRELAPQVAAFNTLGLAPTPFSFLAVQANSACLAVARHLGLTGAALLVAANDTDVYAVVCALAQDAPAVLYGQVEIGEGEWFSTWSYFARSLS